MLAKSGGENVTSKEGKLKKRIDNDTPAKIDQAWGSWHEGKAEAYDNCNKWIDEAKKDFYDIVNEQIPDELNNPEDTCMLYEKAVKKWFGDDSE